MECAWLSIQAAELLILEMLDTKDLQGWLPSVLELAKGRLKADDCRVVELRRQSSRCGRWLVGGSQPEELRCAMKAALVGVHLAMNKYYSRIRRLRNAMWSATMLTTATVVALAIWGACAPETLSLCFGYPDDLVCPHDRATTGQGPERQVPADDPQTEPDRIDVLLVLVYGFMGAVLVGIAMLAKIRESAVPYDLSLASTVLKLPVGALSAFIGIIFVRGEFVPGLTQLDTGAQILGWSAAFGGAQYSVTRLLDKRVSEIVNDSRDGSDPKETPNSKNRWRDGDEVRALQ